MPKKPIPYQPPVAFHPGETLAEKLSELCMGPKEFALRAGKPEKTIFAVINGESSVTPEMAVQFEHVLKIPAHYWLALQRTYDEFIARERQDRSIVETVRWARRFPTTEMVRHGWIPSQTSREHQAVELLAFFRVSSPSAWEDYYFHQQLKVAFRISLRTAKEPYAISAWLRQGEIQAEQARVPSYNEALFKQALHGARDLMVRHPQDLFQQLQHLCREAGVKLVYTPGLKKAPISGCTRWYRDSPLIQVSERRRRNDMFWFTFFHEAGHIILHGKKEIFLEDVEDLKQDATKEDEANVFAMKWTLSEDAQRELMDSGRISEHAVEEFAQRYNTHPAMIVSRLQRDGTVSASYGRRFFVSVDLDE